MIFIVSRVSEVNKTYLAIVFATAAHGATGQLRKYTGEPYIVHCRNVAKMVNDHGGSGDMVSAAWLHDVIEDTEITYHEICQHFGNNIGCLVWGLTDQFHDGNRETRKRNEAMRIAACHEDVQMIKCADIIDNTSSIVRHDPKFAKVYLKEKRFLLDCMTYRGSLWRVANEQV